MNPVLNLGKGQRQTLSHVLSKYLSRTAEGKKIIRTFDKDREAGSSAILEYVDKHLKDQPEFQRQVKKVLGEEAGERFSTIVASGGHVDQIINAEVVEKLSIQYYIFQDSRQVITFLLGVVLIGGMISLGYWWSQQPKVMTGDFNIAVAEFSQVGDAKPKVAEIVSQQVFRFLDDQAKLISFEDVQVSHKNIGIVTSAEEANVLAQRIHAHVVIYGDVTALGTQVRLTPQFYIAEAFRADASELNGQQKLAAPINFLLSELLNSGSDPLSLIQERTIIMTAFTKALVFLAANKMLLAQEAIEQAILHGEQQGPFEGEEILYLFGAHIYRLQGDRVIAQKYIDEAIWINPNYGRAYIAQAHLYYDEGNLYQAIQYFEKAKQLPDQPFGAFINEKADFGIGNSCWVQLQYVNQTPDHSASAELEDCVLNNYQQVIDSYKLQENPGVNLTEITAWAYYGAGTVLQDRGQHQDAQSMYRQALDLTTDQDLIELINPRLQEVEK